MQPDTKVDLISLCIAGAMALAMLVLQFLSYKEQRAQKARSNGIGVLPLYNGHSSSDNLLLNNVVHPTISYGYPLPPAIDLWSSSNFRHHGQVVFSPPQDPQHQTAVPVNTNMLPGISTTHTSTDAAQMTVADKARARAGVKTKVTSKPTTASGTQIRSHRTDNSRTLIAAQATSCACGAIGRSAQHNASIRFGQGGDTSTSPRLHTTTANGRPLRRGRRYAEMPSVSHR